MADHIDLCRYSYGDAREMGITADWRQSFHANVDCARAIEQSIRERFAPEAEIPDAAQPIVARYGFRRVMRVLANTVEQAPPSLPISEENRAWLKTVHVPDDGTFRRYFEVDTANELLDRFITQAREGYEMLHLFEPEHCEPESYSKLNYEGKVLVLSRDTLKEAYWSPEDQLWYAHDGFGCSPTARGRSIACTCLWDGERTRWNRTDFVGVLKEELLPDWAIPCVEQLKAGHAIDPAEGPAHKQAEGPTPGMNMTM